MQKDKDNFINTVKNNFRRADNIEELEDNINKWIEDQKEKYNPVANYDDDEILDSLLILFNGRVGIPLTEDEISDIKEEGKKRYESKVPPGFCDNNKSESEKYSDLIIWKEIINYSKSNKKNIIFITDDKKEDWFYTVKGETIGPRLELSIEFEKETECSFYLYTMDQFLELSKEVSKPALRQSVIDEIKSLRIEDDNSELFEKKLLNLKESYFNQLMNKIESNKNIDLLDLERIIAFYVTQLNDTSQSLSNEDIDLLNYLSGYTGSYYISSTLLNDEENKFVF